MENCICPKCGSVQKSVSNFCTRCGYQLAITEYSERISTEEEPCRERRTRRVISSVGELFDSIWQFLADLFVVLGIIVLGYMILKGYPKAGVFLFVLIWGASGYFWKKAADRRGVSITFASILGNKVIPYERTEEYRFENDSVYREKVLRRLQLKADNRHRGEIKKAEQEKYELQRRRDAEIQRIAKSRWIIDTGIRYNLKDGIVTLNGVDYKCKELKSAKVEIIDGIRYEEDRNYHSEKQRHTSAGGAFAGAVVGSTLGLGFGLVGAAVGGVLMGKTTEDGESHIRAHCIPTCEQINVVVKLKKLEIRLPILTASVDKSSLQYINSMRQANQVIQVIQKIASEPAPAKLPPEKEQSVLAIDQRILQTENEINELRAKVPQYEIPQKYLRR